MAEGYGAHLIKHPELIADMVSQASSRSSLPVSIKIRIHNDLRSVGVVKKTYRGQENLVTKAQILEPPEVLKPCYKRTNSNMH